jgi:serine/threonine-protein kinase RsbW
MMYSYPAERRLRATPVDLALEERAAFCRLHRPAELWPFRDAIEGRMRILGYPGKDIFAVLLALEEAVANAFRHGNGGDPARTILCRFLVTATEVLLEVEDQGSGFDPDQVPHPLQEGRLDRPGGRGLFLMRAYMTWVSYNRAGNRVTLGKQRSEV